ncbi:OmpA family protein [Mameliella alba]|nr:OmpA family protein [Antarctobacter heliothermus]MBY6143628.1 OmpA family protein [Mameliella alba]MCA0952648.1 OmpA family protein [Mameliella alba]
MSAKALVEAIGALVIFLTLAGLGLFQVPSEDPTIEAGLQAQASAILAGFPDPPVLTVKGRTLIVEGLVQSQSERRAIEGALRDIKGMESLDSRLAVLPHVPNFTFSLRKDETGTKVTGYLSRRAASDALARRIGAPAGAIQIARGAPFEDWDPAVLTLAEAMAPLQRGEARLSAKGATITGEALWPADLRAVHAALDELPEGLNVTHDLSARDDGRPFLLVADSHPRRGVTLRGKLPPTVSEADLAAAFDNVQSVELTVGPVDPQDPDLALAMTGAVAVLARAEQGLALVSAGAVVLTNLHGGAELRAALDDLRADLPKGYSLDFTLLPASGPHPFWLQLDRRGETVQAQGYLPREFPPDWLANLRADGAGVVISPYPDTEGWLLTLDPVQDIFAEVIEGRLRLEERGLSLTAVLADPQSAQRVETHLALLPKGFVQQREFDLLDDGRTLKARLSYLPDTGMVLSGVLPADLDAFAAAGLLGLPAPEAALPMDEDAPLPRATALLAVIAPWLAEVEALSLSMSPDVINVEAVLSPGGDLPLFRDQIRAVLAQSDGLDLRQVARGALPPDGTRRWNAALAGTQVLLSGHWLPSLDFAPSVAECARQTRLAGAPRFLPGAARLASGAMASVNQLAAVARVCTGDGGLALRIESHTDNFGAASVNQRLSEQRARLLADALIRRGVPPERIKALGFGADDPVADNDTADGRALNNRTTLIWSKVAASRR